MRVRRHVPSLAPLGARLRAGADVLRLRFERLPGKRSWWIWSGSLVGAFLLGYVIAAVALFPAPIFATAIVVPRLIGQTQATAVQTVENAGLQVGQVGVETHPTAAKGDVVWQDPPPGVAVPRGHAVALNVSGGPQRVPVPDLVGYDAALAEQLVRAAGLRVGRVESTQAPAPRGVVINSRPPTGAALSPGSEVTLVVSVGAPTTSVPDLRGLTRDEAQAVLEAAGLTLGTAIGRQSDRGEPDHVIEQEPAAGTLSAPGAAVNITLARRGI